MTSLSLRHTLSILALASVLILAFTPTSASQIIVNSSGAPGTYSDLQTAINAAPIDAVIWVQGGTFVGPIDIVRPVTIVGSMGAAIIYKLQGSDGPCIRLQGPGSGKVVLAGLSIGGIISGHTSATPSAAVLGSGFDELHIHRCTVQAAKWVSLDGYGYGNSAVSVTIREVLISHSDIAGSPNDIDTSWYPVIPPQPVSIVVSGALLLVDSTVAGPSAPQFIWTPLSPTWPPDPQPCPCPSLNGANSGGSAIAATTVHNVNSTVLPGLGTPVLVWDATTGQDIPYGSQPDGLPYLATTNVVSVSTIGLFAPTPMQIGQPWTLQYPVEWSDGSLYVSFDTSAPYLLGESGWAFFTSPQVVAASPLVPGTTSIGVTWPDTNLLLGRELFWQAYDSFRGLSRPVADIFLP